MYNKMKTDQQIIEIAQGWKEKPETLAELLAFSSQFYKYSVRNNILIHQQNPYAVYVQSFRDWERMGYPVKKGEKGLRIVIPTQSIILKVDEKNIPWKYATKEQKEQYKNGVIEGYTRDGWKDGYVYDISQTRFPKEKYPKVFSMGLPSEDCADAIKGLTAFAKEELECEVIEKDLHSISLRGGYKPGLIQLNVLLEDTQRLDTLSHEIGHAVMDHIKEPILSTSRKEFEADAYSIMINSYLGIPLTDSRKRHLAEHYNRMMEQGPEINPLSVLIEVQKHYRDHVEKLETCLGRYLNLDHIMIKEQLGLTERIGNNTPSEKQFKYASDIAKTLGLHVDENMSKSEMKAFINNHKEDFFKVKSAEQIEEIKQTIKIKDYARDLGLTVFKKGQYYTTQEYDSLRIDDSKNCFWRNSEKGLYNTGSVIDFAAEFGHNGDKTAAIKELKEKVAGIQVTSVPRNQIEGLKQNILQTKVELVLPEAAPNMHRAYAYLIKTRFIDQDVVQDFVNQKMLYQDQRGNCVFVSRDEDMKPNFAFLKGTLSEKKFFRELEGCDYEKGFFVNNRADQLIVTESVIDAMSVMTILQGQGKDYKAYDYLALNGTGKYDLVYKNLENYPKEKVLLALDNDTAGIKATANILSSFEKKEIDCDVSYHLPQTKDWNEDLTKVAKKFQSLTKIKFFDANGMIEQNVENQNKIELQGFSVFPDDPQKAIWCQYIENGKQDLAELYLHQDKDNFRFYYYSGAQYDNSIEEHELTSGETMEALLYEYKMFREGMDYSWQYETDDSRELMKESMKNQQKPLIEMIRQQEFNKNPVRGIPDIGIGIEL